MRALPRCQGSIRSTGTRRDQRVHKAKKVLAGGVAELVDAADLKFADVNVVPVRLRSPPPGPPPATSATFRKPLKDLVNP
jgi:hypothetical protein